MRKSDDSTLSQADLAHISEDNETMLNHVPADLLAGLVWMLGVTVQAWKIVEQEHPAPEVKDMVALAEGFYDDGREWLGEFYPGVTKVTVGTQGVPGARQRGDASCRIH